MSAATAAKSTLAQLHVDPPSDPKAATPRFPWSAETTPPFPDGKGWVVYGYATRFSPQIADGIHVGSVYCAVRSKGAEILARTLTELGIQGVRPLGANEILTHEEYERAYAWVLDGAKGPRPDVVAKVYCGLPRNNGVIFAALPKPARDFVSSLGCK